MLSVEEVFKLEQSEENAKEVSQKKQLVIRLRLAIFGTLALIFILFSPIGLQMIGNLCKPHYQNIFFGKIFQKTTDLLWVYGYYEEALSNYRFIYENTNEKTNPELTQQSFYNIALTYYYMADYLTAEALFRVLKVRWVITDKNLLREIDRRLEIILGLNPGSRCSRSSPKWVYDLEDKWL